MARRVWGEFLVDDTPTQNSKNPVESGGVYSAIESLNIRKKIAGGTVNVLQFDSNTDTSSFEFVNNHIYHLTASLIGSGFGINTTRSGIGYIMAYIGRTATTAHYISRKNVNIQNGVITTNDIRLTIDWRAEYINGSNDNKLHIVVIFDGTSYSFTQSNYELMLVGTDFDGA